MPIDAYWETVALVPQEAFLFTRTIRENIAVADMKEHIEASRLTSAVDDAALRLESLPDGLFTVVGERGLTLSGGQQRVHSREPFTEISALVIG